MEWEIKYFLLQSSKVTCLPTQVCNYTCLNYNLPNQSGYIINHNM